MRFGLWVNSFCFAQRETDGRIGLAYSKVAGSKSRNQRAFGNARRCKLLVRTRHQKDLNGRWQLDLYSIGDGHPAGTATEKRQPTYAEEMARIYRDERPSRRRMN